jgi:hypothetical protein
LKWKGRWRLENERKGGGYYEPGSIGILQLITEPEEVESKSFKVKAGKAIEDKKEEKK